MCDYSLTELQNRPAREGERLEVYRFPSDCLGLASPADFRRDDSEPPIGSRISGWIAATKASSCRPARRRRCACPARLASSFATFLAACNRNTGSRKRPRRRSSASMFDPA